MRLEGKVVVVTGAAMGIGRASALAFAREGASVVVADVAVDEGERTAAETGGVFVRTDVAESADCTTLVAETVERFGRLDVMHANAGVEVCKSLLDTTDEEWRRVLGVNLDGVFCCCREAMRVMRDRGTGGALILTGSPLAFVTGRDIGAYTASKGGVVALMRAFALEGAEFGVRANALLPGTTDTPMIRREVAAATDPDAMLRRWADSVPLGRLAQPEDVAKVAVFLASDDAAFVTGACVAADGGQMAAFNTGPVYGYTD